MFGNRSGEMDLAALGVEFKSPFGPSDGAIVLRWREETEVGRLLFSLQKAERKTISRLFFKDGDGEASHQVDVENGAVVAIHVHGALL